MQNYAKKTSLSKASPKIAEKLNVQADLDKISPSLPKDSDAAKKVADNFSRTVFYKVHAKTPCGQDAPAFQHLKAMYKCKGRSQWWEVVIPSANQESLLAAINGNNSLKVVDLNAVNAYINGTLEQAGKCKWIAWVWTEQKEPSKLNLDLDGKEQASVARSVYVIRGKSEQNYQAGVQLEGSAKCATIWDVEA